MGLDIGIAKEFAQMARPGAGYIEGPLAQEFAGGYLAEVTLTRFRQMAAGHTAGDSDDAIATRRLVESLERHWASRKFGPADAMTVMFDGTDVRVVSGFNWVTRPGWDFYEKQVACRLNTDNCVDDMFGSLAELTLATVVDAVNLYREEDSPLAENLERAERFVRDFRAHWNEMGLDPAASWVVMASS